MAGTHEGMKGMVSEEASSWQKVGSGASRWEECVVCPAFVAFPPGAHLKHPFCHAWSVQEEEDQRDGAEASATT